MKLKTGTPGKPVEQHKAEGTYDPRLHKNRADVFVAPPGTPEPNFRMTIPQRKFYDQIVELLPEKYLGEVDGRILGELLTIMKLLDKARTAVNKDLSAKNINAYLKLVDAFHRLGQEFGITPAARMRIQLPAEIVNDLKDQEDAVAKLKAAG